MFIHYLRIGNVFLFNAFSPIWPFIAIYYNTTDYNLNWFTNCFFIGPITFTFIFNPLILKYFGITQILSSASTALGLWILVMVERNYNLGLLAFMFLGIGSSLSFHVPLYLSKLWFEPSEKIVSTFIGQYSTNIGFLLGYLVSSYYFVETVYKILLTKDDEETFNNKYQNLIKMNAIFALVACAFSFAILKKPKQSQEVSIRENIWASILKICSHYESIFDLVSFSAFIGYSWCYPILFSVQQLTIGQTYKEISITTIIFQFAQIVAGATCTRQLQKQANQGFQLNYDKYIKRLISIGFAFLVIEVLFFDFLSFLLLALINLFIGAGFGGIYSTLLESLMEKHYPVQELAISSLLDAIACGFALIITMILVIPQVLEFGFYIYSILIIPPFCYIILFYKTKFKRFEFEV